MSCFAFTNIAAAKHSRAALELLVGSSRNAWPAVWITGWADSGCGRQKLMNRCDSHGIGYYATRRLGTELAQVQVGTIRLRLMKAAWVLVGARRYECTWPATIRIGRSSRR